MEVREGRAEEKVVALLAHAKTAVVKKKRDRTIEVTTFIAARASSTRDPSCAIRRRWRPHDHL